MSPTTLYLLDFPALFFLDLPAFYFLTRNCLRQAIHQNWQECIDVSHEATETINETKLESSKDLLQDATLNSDGPKLIWKVIQGLTGTPDANYPNEAMFHDGQTITVMKSKAKVFINNYTRVSKLNMLLADCDIKHLNAPFVDDESCAPFRMREFLSAIKKMKDQEAAGPDNILPSFLKSFVLWPSRNYYLGQIWLAAFVFIYLCITRIIVTNTKWIYNAT